MDYEHRDRCGLFDRVDYPEGAQDKITVIRIRSMSGGKRMDKTGASGAETIRVRFL